MTLPCRNNLLVQLSRYLQSFFIGLLQALRIVGCSIKLLGTISSTHQMQHSIIAVAKLGICITLFRDDAVPEIGSEIGRNIHRTTIADDDDRLLQCFSHALETVFQVDLSLESSLLALKEKILVGGEIIHACLGEHGWNLGNGKDLIAKTGEMFNHLNHSGSLARTRSTRQYNLLNLIHISSKYFSFFLIDVLSGASYFRVQR